MSCEIKVGYGRKDIMPIGSIELGGLGNGPHRKSNNAFDILFATCIAITDSEDQTLLLITTDLCHSMQGVTADARKIITEATGIPGDHIMISATHTHAGPDVWNPGPQTVNEYLEQCAVNISKAAFAALEDRKPARVYTAMKKTSGLNFVRHYKRADGTCGAVQTPENPWVGHMTEPDTRLRIVQFEREEGKNILLMNWQAHPCYTADRYDALDISADYISVVRSYLEIMLDCNFAFFQGACGNLVTRSKIKEEYSEREMVPYGKHLGDEVISLMGKLKEIRPAPLQFIQRQYPCPVEHSTDVEKEQATELWNYWLETGDAAKCNSWAKELGYQSVYVARAVLERLGLPKYHEIELNAIRLGELAWATVPGEMFDTCGAYVKDNSPVENTIMMPYCNGAYGYFPTIPAIDYGCYEAATRKYARGSAEEMAENLVEMLRELDK